MQAGIVLADIHTWNALARAALTRILASRQLQTEFDIKPLLIDAFAGLNASARKIRLLGATVNRHAVLLGYRGQLR